MCSECEALRRELTSLAAERERMADEIARVDKKALAATMETETQARAADEARADADSYYREARSYEKRAQQYSDMAELLKQRDADLATTKAALGRVRFHLEWFLDHADDAFPAHAKEARAFLADLDVKERTT